MRFKKFNDIENIRHAKVKETPLKNYTGKIDEVHCSKPSSNTSVSYTHLTLPTSSRV